MLLDTAFTAKHQSKTCPECLIIFLLPAVFCHFVRLWLMIHSGNVEIWTCWFYVVSVHMTFVHITCSNDMSIHMTIVCLHNHCMFTWLYVICSHDRCLLMWPLSVHKTIVCSHDCRVLPVNSICWAPHEFGLMLACGSSDGSISIVSSTCEHFFFIQY